MLINGLYLSSGDLTKIIHTLLPLPYLIEITAQSVNYFLGGDKKYNEMYPRIVDFYLHYEKNSKLLPILKARIEWTSRFVKTFIVLMVALYHIPMIAEFIATSVTGEATYAFYCVLPLMDEKKLTVFAVNWIFHWAALILALFFYMCQAAPVIFNVLQVSLIPKINLV